VDDDCQPSTVDADRFEFHVPGQPQSKLILLQRDPPMLLFELQGEGGYLRTGRVKVLSLAGCGPILSVRVLGNQVIVTAQNGTYTSRDGFLYTRR
jgi:hypothetical protein